MIVATSYDCHTEVNQASGIVEVSARLRHSTCQSRQQQHIHSVTTHLVHVQSLNTTNRTGPQIMHYHHPSRHYHGHDHDHHHHHHTHTHTDVDSVFSRVAHARSECVSESESDNLHSNKWLKGSLTWVARRRAEVAFFC